ncbi:MAG: ADP-ribose pyrophosphatase [Tenericutes bacterium HGW-Tenericutes-4]|jgi:hypothetical protein|nr:MAG: ADP-ribose pyrophosphatase [Tenericutes bacterium HGW-Tenericutes-4]
MTLSQDDKQFLTLYSDSEYEKPSVTVDAVIFRLINKEVKNYRKLPEKKLQVFLTKRQYSPFKDHFSVIGTFINLNTELSNTMKLCVKNKANLEHFYFEQLFTFGDKARDPRTRVLSVSYLLLTSDQEELTNGEWFDVTLVEQQNKTHELVNGYTQEKLFTIELSNQHHTLKNEIKVVVEKSELEQKKEIIITKTDLAFDHSKIIFYALDRLKNKLEYTDIIFNLLPKHFTLTELKQSYEIILGEKLLDANFRRKTAKMVSATSEYLTGKGHRSSQLFKHNPNWIAINIE